MLFYLWTLDVKHVARAHNLLAPEQQGPLPLIGKVRLHIEERLADRHLQQRGRLSIGKRDFHGTGIGLERCAARMLGNECKNRVIGEIIVGKLPPIRVVGKHNGVVLEPDRHTLARPHALDHAAGDTHLRKDLRGVFYRSRLAAAAFTLGAANLVGVPMLSVFITKVTMAQAAVMTGGRHTVIALCALAVSTLLNAYYFLGTRMQRYIPDHEHQERNARVKINVYAAIGLVGFIALNLTLSFCAQGIFGALLDGLTRFA